MEVYSARLYQSAPHSPSVLQLVQTNRATHLNVCYLNKTTHIPTQHWRSNTTADWAESLQYTYVDITVHLIDWVYGEDFNGVDQLVGFASG